MSEARKAAGQAGSSLRFEVKAGGAAGDPWVLNLGSPRAYGRTKKKQARSFNDLGHGCGVASVGFFGSSWITLVQLLSGFARLPQGSLNLFFCV